MGKINQHTYSDEMRQEVVDRFQAGATYKELMEDYGISRDSIRRWNDREEFKRDAEKGILPKGHVLNKATVQYRVNKNTGEHELERYWSKTKQDQGNLEELIRAMLEVYGEDIKPQDPIDPPKVTTEDLLSCYVVSDFHFGQMSRFGEVGEEWDMDIAEELLIKWFGLAINSAPDSDTAILCQLGDFVHFDGLVAVTPSSGHVLDASERYGPMVETVIRVIRHIVNMLLQKHKNVHIIMAEGNHDLASSVWMRKFAAALFDNEPRVTVDSTELPFYAYKWGKTGLFFHHGHKKRPNQVDRALVGEYPEIYGQTEYRYGHVGHYHHKDVKETDLKITIEQHRTLAAKDAHSARGGYHSERSADVITYSKEHGEVSRASIKPNMVV